ncbi:hypothetical protein P4603_08940 [Priestia aryabhattai]|uniref:hypothetical protein n=1 Tax=Priestia aryabhattai TaxID=412384 RepID=UPI0021AD7706|nr:hypothetical protein [Priestia aryabhattai]MDE8673887.1 hypothetical protein [Priestia aryabhattai]MED3952212.1 hypothetical protein [Priestia aryabhattai]
MINKALSSAYETGSFYEGNRDFRESFFNLEPKLIELDDLETLKYLYFKVKDISLRHKLLLVLRDIYNSQLGEFFQKAYKKERDLEMKLIAVRGLVKYVEEHEISKSMNHFMKILIKRLEHTPYNYKEYEYLRSPSGLPYLIKEYNYNCFHQVLEQVEKQYEAMPFQFKNHYTYDENDNIVELRSPDETDQMIEDFFKIN